VASGRADPTPKCFILVPAKFLRTGDTLRAIHGNVGD
jgi:hypothetical protein